MVSHKDKCLHHKHCGLKVIKIYTYRGVLLSQGKLQGGFKGLLFRDILELCLPAWRKALRVQLLREEIKSAGLRGISGQFEMFNVTYLLTVSFGHDDSVVYRARAGKFDHNELLAKKNKST